MPNFAALFGLHFTSLGLTAAQAQAGELNYLGIAALITAVSGLIGTVGALLLAMRRKDPSTELLNKYLEAQAKKLLDEEDNGE